MVYPPEKILYNLRAKVVIELDNDKTEKLLSTLGKVNGLTGIRGITDSPLYRAQVKRENLQEYEASAFKLTDEQIEKIVLSIASGRNTFKDICEAVPGINSATVQEYLQNTPPQDNKSLLVSSDFLISKPYKKTIIEFVEIPDGYETAYEFKETDTFKLTVDGENISYRLKKEKSVKDETLRIENNAAQRHEESMKLNKKVFWAAVITILLSAVTLIRDLLK